MDRHVTAGDRRAGGRRLVAAAVIVAVHLMFLAVLTMPRPPLVPRFAAAAMTVRAVPAAPVAPPAAPTIAVDLAAPAIEVAEPAAAPGAPCAIEEAVAAALAGDPATLAALMPLAAEPTRAIMVWDGAWSRLPAAQPIRRVVVASIAATGRSCQDAPVVGPRLIFVPIAGTTISVAIGSGGWSWRLLLSEDQDTAQ